MAMDPGGTQANVEKPWRTAVSAFQCIIKTVLRALFVLLLLSHGAYADERTWPQLDDGDTKNGVCNTALAIAVSMYRSDNFFLYAPPDLRSPDFVSNFALRPEGTDVSAGDALVADWSIFQKIPKPPDGMPSPRSVYWQIGSRLGLRYVLVEDAFGWLHLLPVDGDFEGVEAHALGRGPDGCEAVGPAAGVVDLRAEDEVGLAVDHEGRAALLGDEAR